MRSTEVDDSSVSRRHRPYTEAHRQTTTARRLEALSALSVDVLLAYHISYLRYLLESRYSRHQSITQPITENLGFYTVSYTHLTLPTIYSV